MIGGAHLARRPEAGAKIRVACKLQDGRGESARIVRRHDDTGFAVQHGFGVTAHIGDE